jgi:hypothetical protein
VGVVGMNNFGNFQVFEVRGLTIGILHHVFFLVYFLLQPKALGQNFKVCLEAPLQSIKKNASSFTKEMLLWQNIFP